MVSEDTLLSPWEELLVAAAMAGSHAHAIKTKIVITPSKNVANHPKYNKSVFWNPKKVGVIYCGTPIRGVVK